MGWELIVDHIDHVVKLVGADHVGLGSDFDGADVPHGGGPRAPAVNLDKGHG